MRSLGAAAAALGGFFLIGGLAWPFLAGRLLDVLLATLAVAYVGARAYRSRLPTELRGEAYSPFEKQRPRSPSLEHPAPIHDLAVLLRAADDRDAAERSAIPLAVQSVVSREVARRLDTGRDLTLDDPSHHPRIRRLVSEPLWALIRPGTEHPNRPHLRDPVALKHLGDILDELERL